MKIQFHLLPGVLLGVALTSIPVLSVDEAQLNLLHDPHHTTDLDIIFIHGLGGDPIDTWTSTNTKNQFFTLLGNDPQLKHIKKRIWSFGYPNDVLSLSDRAETLLSHMWNKIGIAIDADSCESCDAPILLITHDTGGLLAKSAVVEGYDRRLVKDDPFYKLVKRLVGVVFYATPHQGTNLANYVDWFFTDNKLDQLRWLDAIGGFSPAREIKDLNDANQQLTRLNVAFNKIIAVEDIKVLSFFESKKDPKINKIVVSSKHYTFLVVVSVNETQIVAL